MNNYKTTEGLIRKVAAVVPHGAIIDADKDGIITVSVIKNKFVDDGLHQGQSVEFWENILYHIETQEHYDNLQSAIAFRDGDAEGYRAMHGGV